MSNIFKTAIAALFYWMSTIVLANTLAYVDRNMMFGAMSTDGSDFCDHARLSRDNLIRNDPSLASEAPLHLLKSSFCFSPDENLLYVAILEAQKVLGKNSLWYSELQGNVNGRVKKACDVIGYQNNDTSHAYENCLESRYEELMSPHLDEYERETVNYLRKREKIANSLMVRCDSSLNVKRYRLPKEIRFPVGWYNSDSRSVPEWLMEDKLNDDDWLEKLHKMKFEDMMVEVVGNDCPGEMIYWVTYN